MRSCTRMPSVATEITYAPGWSMQSHWLFPLCTGIQDMSVWAVSFRYEEFWVACLLW